MNDFSKKLRRGAEVTTCLLALALCASFALGLTSCENGHGCANNHNRACHKSRDTNHRRRNRDTDVQFTNNELRFKSAKPRKSGWRHNFC